MKQEEKELLFKDLCMRLPYGVIVHYKNKEKESDDVILGTGNIHYVKELGGWWKKCKPYLRPMSSMTEDENKRFDDILTKMYYHEKSTLGDISDYLNSIHVDYRGLIEKGLAIEITKENNPYKD